MSDPFELLNLEPRFDLDEAALERAYLTASAASHPDRFADPVEQADAADRSARINEAYRSLKNPEARAKGLLARLGGSPPGDDPPLPPNLLMQMMEDREDLEQAIANEDELALQRHRNWADEQRRGHLDRIAVLFTQAPVDGREVQRELNALRYIERMLEQLPD
jgi:molecular chaperone HscB